MKIMRYLIIIASFFIGFNLQAEDANLLFTKANKAFQEYNYSEAIALYEQIREQNKHSVHYYFNLGNAYYKNKNLGKAMLNYEKAKLLKPNFSDLQHNMDITENRLKDNISPVRPFFLAEWWQSIYNLMLPRTWAVLGIFWLLAAVGGIGFWLLSTTRQQKQLGFYGGISIGILGIIFLLAGLSRHQAMTNSNAAIVVAKQTAFKDGADIDSNTMMNLHEGAKVFLIENIGDWYKVRLNDGEIGWLKIGEFEEITLL